eukprot:2573933-Pleurochrysis_carterae.AAC.1
MPSSKLASRVSALLPEIDRVPTTPAQGARPAMMRQQRPVGPRHGHRGPVREPRRDGQHAQR